MIIRADTREIVDALCEARFDAMVVDPPYAARVHDRAASNGTDGAGPHKRDMGFACLDETLRAAIVCIARSVRRWTCVFSDIETAHLWRAPLDTKPLEYIRTVPWVRWSQPQLSGDRPPSGCELVTLAHPRAAKRWSGPGNLTAFDDRALRGAGKYACEKPLDLMLSLVSWFSDAGETIVDPCCGAGTTALACALLGRECIAVDIGADACARANARLSAPLSARDCERCERWVEYQRAWLHDPPDTAAGAARYDRATRDTERVESALAHGSIGGIQ